MAKLMFVFLALPVVWEVGAKALVTSKTVENGHLGKAD